MHAFFISDRIFYILNALHFMLSLVSENNLGVSSSQYVKTHEFDPCMNGMSQ